MFNCFRAVCNIDWNDSVFTFISGVEAKPEMKQFIAAVCGDIGIDFGGRWRFFPFASLWVR
jgi:hypothetical protein